MSSSLLKTVDIAGEQFDLGSDFHQGLEGQKGLAPHEAGQSLARDIVSSQRSSNLLLPGDLFHAEKKSNWRDGLDVSAATNELLVLLRRSYDRILYVPGNHCLRREEPTDDPWDHIDPPHGVVMPRGNRPEIVQIGHCRILVANLLYDGHFIPNHHVGGDDFIRLVEGTTDGGYLLRGADSVPLFREMTRAVAAALTQDIDLLVTHVPTHPSSVRWRTYGEGDVSMPRDFEGSVVSDPLEDARIAAYWNASPEWVRERINAKAAMLGSNVFDPVLHAGAKDGLVSVYGHHHRDEDRTANVDGKDVRFVAHQRMQWKRE